jgi:hypothetical protein
MKRGRLSIKGCMRFSDPTSITKKRLRLRLKKCVIDKSNQFGRSAGKARPGLLSQNDAHVLWPQKRSIE